MSESRRARTITDLREVAFPEEFREGARNAVTTCLRIKPEEKVTLITDESCVTIAACAGGGAGAVGCAWNAFVLEEVARAAAERDAAARCWTTWRARR